MVDEIERYLPDEVLCARQVGRVLALLEATGTALVERVTTRTWRIRLADLQSPSSAIYKAVCADIPRGRRRPRPPTAGEMLRAGAAAATSSN
jgi:hypothetical protein